MLYEHAVHMISKERHSSTPMSIHVIPGYALIDMNHDIGGKQNITEELFYTSHSCAIS